MSKMQSVKKERSVEECVKFVTENPAHLDAQLAEIKALAEHGRFIELAIEQELVLAEKDLAAHHELKANRFRVEKYLYELALHRLLAHLEDELSVEKALDRIHRWVKPFERLDPAFSALRIAVESRVKATLSAKRTSVRDRVVFRAKLHAMSMISEPFPRVSEDTNSGQGADPVTDEPQQADEDVLPIPVRRPRGLIHSPSAAQRISEFIEIKDYDRSALAERFGVTDRAIRRNLKEGRLSTELLKKFARLMKTSVAELTAPLDQST